MQAYLFSRPRPERLDPVGRAVSEVTEAHTGIMGEAASVAVGVVMAQMAVPGTQVLQAKVVRRALLGRS